MIKKVFIQIFLTSSLNLNNQKLKFFKININML